MAPIERRALERLRYQPGQRLASRDLNDQMAIEAQYRWWHNRALHSAYGVAYGLRSALEGADHIVVTPGVAYDAYGRELYSDEALRIAIPADPKYTLLMARFREMPRNGHHREIACPPAFGHKDGVTTIELFWFDESTRHPHIRDGVILARRSSSGGSIISWEDLDPTDLRHAARPLARPRIAHGATSPADWERWDVDPDEPGHDPSVYPFKIVNFVFIQARKVQVDTTAAGFVTPPLVFATLQAENWGGVYPTQPVDDWRDGGDNCMAFNTFERVGDVTSFGFTFYLYVALPRKIYNCCYCSGQFRNPDDRPDFVQLVKPYISWIGVEPTSRNFKGE